jgi:hypothetical protein
MCNQDEDWAEYEEEQNRLWNEARRRGISFNQLLDEKYQAVIKKQRILK